MMVGCHRPLSGLASAFSPPAQFVCCQQNPANFEETENDILEAVILQESLNEANKEDLKEQEETNHKEGISSTTSSPPVTEIVTEIITETETETGETPTNDDPSPTENTEPNDAASGGPQTMAAISSLLADIKAQLSGGGGGSPTGGDNPSGNPENPEGGQNTDENGDGGLTDGDGTGDGDDTGSGVQTGDGTGTGEEGTEGGDGEGAGDPGIGAGFGGLLAGLGAGAGLGGSGDRPVWNPLDDYTPFDIYRREQRQMRQSLNEGLLQAAMNRRTA